MWFVTCMKHPSQHDTLTQCCFNINLTLGRCIVFALTERLLTSGNVGPMLVQPLPSKHKTPTQRRFNVGPPSATLAQHWTIPGVFFVVSVPGISQQTLRGEFLYVFMVNINMWRIQLPCPLRDVLSLFNPLNAEIKNLNFHPLEAVSRYRDPQLQVAENYLYLFNLRPNICKAWCLNTHFIPNKNDLIGQ